MTLLLDRPRLPVPDVHDDATRREFIVGGVATGLLVVAGCGSDEDRTDAAAPPTTEGHVAFPVTIDHKYGSTEIPAEPKRVVTVGLTDQDSVLALGSPGLRAQLDANPLYEQLDVVEQGRVVFLEDPPRGENLIKGALAWSTVLSLPFVLGELVPVLTIALDGDPCHRAGDVVSRRPAPPTDQDKERISDSTNS